jgi:CheY-like chemotaxis protein
MRELLTLMTTPPDRSDDDVAPDQSPASDRDIANILIVEQDADCADALETILADLPGIETVQSAETTANALTLLDEDEHDGVGFGVTCDVAPAPDVIFIGADQPDSSEAAIELLETLTTFRRRLPNASIVLLCVYPSQYRDALGDLIDGCIRKDTNARELRRLIEKLRTDCSTA